MHFRKARIEPCASRGERGHLSMDSVSRTRPLESKRIALHRKIVLRFPDFDGFVTEYSANLSMTGMFIRSSHPHPPGTPVSFQFKLSDGMDLIAGTGLVVWVRETDEGEGSPSGMGIEFSEISADSRRLIRWVILHQLPPGEKPFDLASYDESGRLVGERPAGEGAALRNMAVGAAAAVAVFLLALAAASLWPRESAVESDGSTVLAPPAVALESPSVEPVSAEDPSLQPEQAPPSVAASSSAAIEDAVLGWAEAWSSQDADAYLRSYAAEFEPDDGTARSVWEGERRERLRSPAWIRVALTDLQIERISEDSVRVVFNQAYRSDSFSDLVRKTLLMRRENGGWKITRETAGEADV
jgi:uncharacterized protein (TIGR02266 family)